MKHFLALCILVGVVTLTIVIGQRMSNDATAILVGVIFGVAASIPTSLLIALAARGSRRPEPVYRREDSHPVMAAPQIYVVTPGAAPAPGLQQPAANRMWPPAPAASQVIEPARRYHVVGESDYWLDEADNGRVPQDLLAARW